MDLLVFFILVLSILSFWRMLNQHYAGVKFRVRLKNLNIELNELIKNNCIPQGEAVKIIQRVIVDSIQSYNTITVYSFIMQSIANRNQHSKNYDSIFKEVENNKSLSSVYKKFAVITTLYLKEQQGLVIWLFTTL